MHASHAAVPASTDLSLSVCDPLACPPTYLLSASHPHCPCCTYECFDVPPWPTSYARTRDPACSRARKLQARISACRSATRLPAPLPTCYLLPTSTPYASLASPRRQRRFFARGSSRAPGAFQCVRAVSVQHAPRSPRRRGPLPAGLRLTCLPACLPAICLQLLLPMPHYSVSQDLGTKPLP